MSSLFAKILVFAGVLILIGGLTSVRQLIASLPAGTLRRRWYVMAVLIGLFIVGYVGYAVAFWNHRHYCAVKHRIDSVGYCGWHCQKCSHCPQTLDGHLVEQGERKYL